MTGFKRHHLAALAFGAALAATVGAVGAQDLPVDDALRADRDAVRLLQGQLNDLGFDAGSPDGAYGRRTAGALEAFAARFPSDVAVGLTPVMAARVGMVHDSRFMSPFETGELLRPTSFLPSRTLLRTDSRETSPQCGETCSVTTFILAVGDMTGDGIDEVVYGHHAEDANGRVRDVPTRLAIASPGAEDNIFDRIAFEDFPERVHEREGVIADFNGDGIGDLFVSAHGLDSRPFPGEQNVLLLSEGEGHMDASLTHLPQVNDMAHGVATGDLEGDGDIDIIVMTNEGSTRVLPYVLRNDGAGMFTQEPMSAILDEPSLVDMYTMYDRGGPHRASYSTVRLTDLNGDDAPDLLLLARGEEPGRAARHSQTRQSLVIYNDGSGAFPIANLVELPTDRWGLGTFTNDADAVDLDGDGAMDLILTQSTRLPNNGSWRGHYLQVLMQEDGVFVDRTAERMWHQGYPGDMQDINFADKTMLADLDGDGDLDVITRSLAPSFRLIPEDDGIIQIGMNDGTGRFEAVDPRWISGERGYNGRQPFAADFDGDGVTEFGSWSLYGDFSDGNNQTFGGRVVMHMIPGR